MRKYKDIILSILISLAIAVILFAIIYTVVKICDDSIENKIVNLVENTNATRVVGTTVELIQYKNSPRFCVDKVELNRLMAVDPDFAGKYHSIIAEMPAKPAW